MDTKHLNESGWKTICAKFKLKDNGLTRALWTYEKLDEDKYDERLKAIVQVAGFAGSLRRSKDVAEEPDAAKYLANVANEAEFMRRKIASDKAVAQEKEKQELLEREETEREDEEEANPNAEKDYKKFSKTFLEGLNKVISGGGKEFQWVSGKKDSTRHMPVSGILVAPMVNAEHKKLITRVTGSQHFATGTCLLEEGKLTFVVDEFDPSKFVTEIRRSIQYFTGKKFAVRARGSEDTTAAEEDPNEDLDGPEDQNEEQDSDDPPKFVPGVLDEPPVGTGKPKPGKPRKGASPATEEHEAEAEAQEASSKTSEEKESATGATRPFEISAPVGQGGRNNPEDVEAVQVQLNLKAKAGLVVDGKCGPKTIAAIKAYQKTLGMSSPDGLIEPGKSTAAGLSGKPVSFPAQQATGPGGGGKGGGAAGSKKPGAAGGATGGASAGSVFGVAIGVVTGAIGQIVAEAVKEAQEAEARKNALEKMIKDLLKKMKEAGTPQSGEGKRIWDELQKAYKENQDHIKKLEKAAKDLADRKTKEAAEALKHLAEQAVPILNIVERTVESGIDWIVRTVPAMGVKAQELAKEVTKEISDRKKAADEAYHDIINKMKKAAEDELGPEGKAMKEELEKAYKENQEHIKKVAEAAKELAARKTEEAADALKKAAEMTSPGFVVVENLVQKATDWWNSD